MLVELAVDGGGVDRHVGMGHSVADGPVFVERGARDVQGDEPRGSSVSPGAVISTTGGWLMTGLSPSGMSGHTEDS